MECWNFFNDLKSNIVGQYADCRSYRLLCEIQGYNLIKDLESERDIVNILFIADTIKKNLLTYFLALLQYLLRN
ncbi:hypothetical protein KYB31_08830 [Clostridium felsineum]|uniref:hypothetical protein n=2 Tax=Clostridium felsineum TaxID=36839 RepID=UPI00098CC102|nr:hypothetical protein [Clostridium felsineum]MCR3759093.1 hypothetical protein [Clostridium felsineum]URZ00207.1 hypothetical protein CLAUR_001950 [Clostridium felsineum]